ncbi:MAG: hypothetical protein ACRC6X_05750 [Culicoidibacterales bacterium]
MLSSYKGKSVRGGAFIQLIDMIILRDNAIGKKTAPKQAFNLFKRYLRPATRYAAIETVCLKTYYTYVKP